MTTFWKGFAIFWIIFLVWYLTGGPQRVNTSDLKPTTTFDLNNVTASPESSNTSFSDTQPPTDGDTDSQTPVKSFPNKPKTNTIDLSN